jgi:hypothetical protein
MTTQQKCFGKLQGQVRSILPVIERAVSESEGGSVTIANVPIAFEEAKQICEEFRTILESTQMPALNMEVIPMRLLTADYAFRAIQQTMNELRCQGDERGR